MPEFYEFLEAERIKYAIRLPANQVLQGRIGYLLKRPVGRPPHEVLPCRSLLCRKSPLSRVGTSRQSRKPLQFAPLPSSSGES
jgi:hypothetical protein